ncbi:MAG: hypothetical protein MOGMAGMI_01010 [Candidatus Omnitrophica bacterium]|nr:hypothetical protein [Candidatus Omnitrophota bacterium]
MLPTVLCLVVIFGYVFSFALYFINFELRNESLTAASRRTVELTLLAHLSSLVYLIGSTGGIGGSSLAHHVIPILIVGLCYFMERGWGGRNLLLFALPITVLFCLLAVFSSQPPLAGGRSGPWFLLHAGFMFGGFAGLLAAVSSALMYLVQSAQLKSKHLGRAFLRLPSLGALDRLHSRALLIGVACFSAGILCGLLWARHLNGSREVLMRDPKIILSFFTYALYGLILALRLSNVRRGHKIALGTVIAFAALTATFVSSHPAPALLVGA